MAYIGLSFERLYRNPACGVATLVLNEFKIFAPAADYLSSLGTKISAQHPNPSQNTAPQNLPDSFCLANSINLLNFRPILSKNIQI
nr:hypothetical protein [uncultured Campylobacter sp.]